MKTYQLFRRPDRKWTAVKLGVSWPALFFGPLWMSYNSLLVHAAISGGAALLLLSVEPSAGLSLNTLIVWWSVLNALPCLMGNRWRTARLIEEGYECFTSVQANAPDEAVSCGRAMLAAAAESEVWKRIRTTRAPAGLDLSQVPTPKSVRAWVSGGNNSSGIAHEMWQRYVVRWL